MVARLSRSLATTERIAGVTVNFSNETGLKGKRTSFEQRLGVEASNEEDPAMMGRVLESYFRTMPYMGKPNATATIGKSRTRDTTEYAMIVIIIFGMLVGRQLVEARRSEFMRVQSRCEDTSH
jgi:hypothetical protein